MIIKLQGMNKDTWFYDTNKVQVKKRKYTDGHLNNVSFGFDLLLVNSKHINDYEGYLFTFDDKSIFTELDVWIDGEQING